MKQFYVRIDYQTQAETPEEALAIACSAIKAANGGYVSIQEEDSDMPVIEGEIGAVLHPENKPEQKIVP